MRMFEILEEIEKTKTVRSENTLNKSVLMKKGLEEDKNLYKYLNYTFSEDFIYNISDKSIENSLNIKTLQTFKDIGEKVKWFIENNGAQSSLLIFCGINNQFKSFEDFEKLILELQKTSGNEALELLKIFLTNCQPIHAKWYCRCLVKKLSCGIDIISVNKIMKEMKLPEIEKFALSLCEPISLLPEKEFLDKLQHLSYPIAAEPKYDGVRMIVKVGRGKQSIALSRNGKKIETVNFILNEVERLSENYETELDGELIADEGFNKLMTQVHRKHDLSSTIPRKFMIFDITIFKGNHIKSLPYEKRREMLMKFMEGKESNLIKIAPQKILKNSDEVQSMFTKSIGAGYEGIILKELNYPYTPDRKGWFKIKPTQDISLIIMGYELGTGKYKDLISVLQVKDLSGELNSSVGSGLTDEIREDITKNKDMLIGRMVEIAYDSITPKNETGLRSLRFPRFIKFRDDLSKPDSILRFS